MSVVKRKTPTATVSTAPKVKYAQLLVHSVSCVKTTKEIDRDEIVVAGIRTTAKVAMSGSRKKLVASAKKGEVLNVGKFKKGHKVTYKKPKLLVQMPLGKAGAEWPRYMFATLLMIEKDQGAIGTVVNAAVKSVEKEVTTAIKTAATTAATGLAASVVAGAAAGSVVPIVGTAAGAAAAAATTAALKAIKKSRADDVFPPKKVQQKVARSKARPGPLANSRQVLNFKGFKGHYRVVISWNLQ